MLNQLKQAQETNILAKNDIIALLNDSTYDNDIFTTANKIRANCIGNEIHLRALIEISNICKNNCLYCGLRCNNTKAERYKLSTKEVIECVELAHTCNIKTIVLQSGESSAYSDEELINLIKEIKNYNMAVTLSLGEKTYEQYQAYKEAGANRYLLRIETTDNSLYTSMHPNMSLKKRIECLLNLKNLGYELGTGCLVGLPNQTLSSLADDILFFKKIKADMIGIGPFIPHQDTPLKNKKGGNLQLALKVMALTRILLPNINIPATTAMEIIQKDGKTKALQCGANVIMVNFGNIENQKKYLIYPGKTNNNQYIDNKFQLDSTINLINKLNRNVSNSIGQSKSYNNNL